MIRPSRLITCLIFACATIASPSIAQNKERVSTPPAPRPTGFTVSTSVTPVTKDGDIILNTDLTKDNFKVYECKNAKKRQDCIEQDIIAFRPPESSITAVLTLEYSYPAFIISCLGNYDPNGCGYYGSSGAIQDAPAEFIRQLRPEDWVAFAWFDARTHLEIDTTKDKSELLQSLAALLSQPPSNLSESNLADTVMDLVGRIDERSASGDADLDRAAIILISTGINTFSRQSMNELFDRLKNTPVAIYPVRIGKAFENRYDSDISSLDRITLLAAANQMREIADLTGGKAYAPGFAGELNSVFGEIASILRSQYTLTWQPKNLKRDGKFHEIRVEITGAFVDSKTQKPLTVEARHRKGYLAPRDRR